MLFLLSPAKSLDYDSPIADLPHTRPLFVDQSHELIRVLRAKSPLQVGKLMDISDSLAALNVARYQAWSPRFTANNSRQAALAFNGDVYHGLAARTLSADDLGWAQDHLCILSGLYGVLRPMDRMQPYRLEMGTQLAAGGKRNLYGFWNELVASYLNRRVSADKTPVVVNLASLEYSKVVDRNRLQARVIDCVFEEGKPGAWRIVSFFAKQARGLMARYAIVNRASLPAQLEGFAEQGYAFDGSASRPDRLVFRRRTS